MDLLDKELAKLVNDPGFQAYVLRNDPEAIAHWQAQLAETPKNSELYQRAAGIIHLWESGRQELPAKSIQQNWAELASQLDGSSVIKKKPSLLRRFGLISLLAACLGGGLFLIKLPKNLTPWLFHQELVQTVSGETGTICLPDGSTVMLNANSRLIYYTPWKSDEPREVWLEGEGFFDVSNQPESGGAQFRVHLAEVQVEVLGTRFNVNSRRNRTQVVLEEGSVQLTHKEKEDVLQMVPGEMVEYGENELFIRRKVDPNPFTAWVENRLIFDDTSLRTIGEMIMDRYGLNVEIIGSEDFARRTFSGEAVVEELSDLILVLESFDIQIDQDTNRLQLREVQP
jgi:ferric-dicitrate binding protein FerR (iron transport regulator)